MRKGSSLDFAEHRSYQPGDDLRRIDWRVYGRTDRFYIKEYDADTNAERAVRAGSRRARMDFGSGAVTKFDYARFLTASLAWLSQQQGDRVGLATFTGDLVDVVPPSVRHLQLMLHTLARDEGARAPASWSHAIERRRRARRARGHRGARHRLLRAARRDRARHRRSCACAGTT